MAKTTAIRAPTTDPVNHQIVLRQLKEASETANRLRGNARDSFAQVGELVDAGIVRLVDDKLVSPTPSSLPPTVVPSTRQIKTGGSIQGGGTLATDLSLELVGDTGSPGNNMVYGTNGSGVKGWYTGGSGGSSTLAGLSDVSLSSPTNGQVLTYDSGSSKWKNQAGGGAGSGALPGTISDLAFWWESDNLLVSNGNGIMVMQDRTPWYGLSASPQSTRLATCTTGGLNSLPTAAFTSAGEPYVIPGAGFVLKNATIFVVFSCSAPAGPVAFIGTSGGSGLVFRIYANVLGVLSDLVGGGGAGTATVVANTWYQANVTYADATGAFAFRQARTAAGSGTGSVNVVTAGTNWLGSGGGGSENYQGSIAAIIVYNRVLSSAEITSVENYLFAKWGV
jgi:hypothetical protein